eukprot:363893-Chlamydomonas_euryale.AAC.8
MQPPGAWPRTRTFEKSRALVATAPPRLRPQTSKTRTCRSCSSMLATSNASTGRTKSDRYE